MRTWKLMAASALMALVVSGPAAATESHTFTAPVPCAVTCPYWTDVLEGHEAACRTPPLSLPGSFDDWNIAIPSGYSAFHFEIAPRIDYDSWLCYAPSNPGPNGTFFIESGALTLECPYLFGCAERIDYCISATDVTCLAPGTNVIFRVYNWSDPAPSIVGTLVFFV